MFNKAPVGGRLLQEDGFVILLEDGFNLLWDDAEELVPYSFKPLAGFTESIQFNTDIIPTYENEQRIAIRTLPVTQYNFRFYLTEQEFREIKQILKTWQYRAMILPIWTDSTVIASISSSDTNILFNTVTSDYRAESYVLFDTGTNIYLRYVESVASDRIVLDSSIGFTGTNVKVMPTQEVIITGGAKFNRGALNNNFANIIFRTIKNKDLSANGSFTQYKGLDVLLDCQPILSGINESIERTVDAFDNGSGLVEYVVNNDYITRLMTCNFVDLSLSERAVLKRFVHKMKGRRGSFWLPTFHNDIVINANITSGQNYIDVDAFGYGYFNNGETPSFVIELINGTRYFNTILSSTRSSTTERFTLESTISANINISNIKRVMFIHKVRFDSDVIEFNYVSNQITQVSLPVKEVLE